MPARLTLTVISLALTPLIAAEAQSHAASAATIAHLVDSVAARAVADGFVPALGVAVTMDGKTIYSKSHGMADAAAGIRADDKTLWYIASTSKSFTGFGISLLADRGALRFDAPIQTLLPNVRWNPEVHAESLTLANFLSHTHHINDDAVVSSAAFTGAIPESHWPDLIVLAKRHPTDDLIYSNFGYNVAAMVIDRLRPEGWRKFLEQNVFLPAGMRDTYSRVSGLEKRIAKPHRLTANGTYVTEPFLKTDRTMNSAGGQVGTLRDFARWTIVQMDSGMIDGKRVFPKSAVVLSQTLIAKQTRDQAKRFAFFDREGWGAGWDIGSYQGERMVSRFGGYSSTQSRLSFLPARRTGVVAMITGGAGNVGDIITALVYDLEAGRPDALQKVGGKFDTLRIQLAGGKAGIAREDSIRASRQTQQLRHALADFAGTYEAEGYGRVVFSVSGGRLSYRWGDMYGPVEIYDASKDQMRLEIAGSGNVISFTFPETGPATTVNLQGKPFKRVPAT